MIVDTALEQALRTLKLSGMLQTLDSAGPGPRWRARPHRVLQVLCHDEMARRESQSMARRIRRAQFEQQVTLEEFDFATNSKLPAAQIRDLAALRWLSAGESVILYGPVGVGKTHVAQALGHLAARKGAEVRFQVQQAASHPRRWTRRPHLGQMTQGARPNRRADPRRFRHPRVDRHPG